MLPGTNRAAADIKDGATLARSTRTPPPKEIPACSTGCFSPSKPRPLITSEAHLPFSNFSGFKSAGSLLLPAAKKSNEGERWNPVRVKKRRAC